MVIVKPASRKIAFKAAKVSKTAFGTQAAFVTRGVGEEALSICPRSFSAIRSRIKIWDITLTYGTFIHL